MLPTPDLLKTHREELEATRLKTVWLQGLGAVEGVPAGQIIPGQTTVWNNGGTETVTGILRETNTTVTWEVSYTDSWGKTKVSSRTCRKDRIVAVQDANGKITRHNLTKSQHQGHLF